MAIDRKKITKDLNTRLDQASRKIRTTKVGYQKYFDGYTTFIVRKKNGKGTKTLRIYTDDYYTHDCEDKAWVRQKLLFAGLTVLAIALFLFAALGPSASSLWTPVIVTGSLAMAAIVIYVPYMVFYLAAPRLMTHFTQTHYHKLVLVFCFLSWVCEVVTAVLNLAFLLFVRKSGYLVEALSTLSYALSAAALWGVWQKERHTDYCTVPNDPELPRLEDLVLPGN